MWLCLRGKDPRSDETASALEQTQTFSQETRGQKVTGLGVEGGVSVEPGRKNAIIQEMIEEFLQDWPEESPSLNSGGLRTLSTQWADTSVDPLGQTRLEGWKELLFFINPGARLCLRVQRLLRKGTLLFY